MTQARTPLQEAQRFEVTPLELFFDLFFVFAVSQLSHHLLEHLTGRGAAETLVLLLAVYRTWSTTSWDAPMLGVNGPDARAMLLTVMGLGLFLDRRMHSNHLIAGVVLVIAGVMTLAAPPFVSLTLAGAVLVALALLDGP